MNSFRKVSFDCHFDEDKIVFHSPLTGNFHRYADQIETWGFERLNKTIAIVEEENTGQIYRVPVDSIKFLSNPIRIIFPN